MLGLDGGGKTKSGQFRRTFDLRLSGVNNLRIGRIAMGLFDFVKDIGKKLFSGEAEAADKIKNHIQEANPGITGLDVSYDNGVVSLSGQASSQKRTVFYKPAAPDLAVTAPAEDVITSQKSLTVKGMASAVDGLKVTAEINGIPKQVAVDAGRFSIPVEFQQEGAYTVTLYAGAAGGDVSTVSRTIVYRKAQ